MIKNIKILTCASVIALAGCASSVGWQASHHQDEFTNTKSCRVEKGSKAQRDFARGFTGSYFTQHFYAENYDGEVRAGVRSEPSLPIAGDVQIKVGEKLYTLTSKDAPIDVAPSVATPTVAVQGYQETIDEMTKNIQQLNSPYRAFKGKKAIELLRDIAKSSNEVKFRVVGVNQALSGTGTFNVGDDFVTALNDCGIDIE